jgi:chaperonin GroEL
MIKQLLFGNEAKDKIRVGVNTLADAVSTTLGPRGKNVGIGKSWGYPQVIHDGVSIAKEIRLKDPFEDIGAQLVRQASERTNDEAGDGTTSSALLAQSLINGGMDLLTNPMQLTKELKEASKLVSEKIKEMAVPITSKEQKQQVATVSAQDEELGRVVAEAMEEAGEDGSVVVEDSRGFDTEVTHRKGFSFNRGYKSPYFVTDNKRMVSEIRNPKVLVTDQRLEDIKDIAGLLVGLENVVIIADDISEKALAILVSNMVAGRINVLAIQAPGFGERREENLRDICALTNAVLISESKGMKLSEATPDSLGTIDKIISTKNDTTMVGGADVTDYVKGLKNIETTSQHDADKLKDRIARLSGGISVIKVGASTETELYERKLRVEDAVNAVKSAMDGGIVVGAGMALYEARKAITTENAGSDLLKESLKDPAKKIIENAGLSWDLGHPESSVKYGKGIDVITGDMVDLIDKGIIDPAKVVLNVLENAVSVASSCLTMEVLIVDEEEKND